MDGIGWKNDGIGLRLPTDDSQQIWGNEEQSHGSLAFGVDLRAQREAPRIFREPNSVVITRFSAEKVTQASSTRIEYSQSPCV
jgi:hypothetical protein